MDGYTALMMAARYGHDTCVELLIQAGADVNKQEDSCTALIGAALDGHHKHTCLKLLIGAGADVNTPDDEGRTALMWEGMNGHDKYVEILVQAGVDVNKVDGYGYTPLLQAAQGCHDKCLEVLI